MVKKSPVEEIRNLIRQKAFENIAHCNRGRAHIIQDKELIFCRVLTKQKTKIAESYILIGLIIID
jgi:hypothetical protein